MLIPLLLTACATDPLALNAEPKSLFASGTMDITGQLTYEDATTTLRGFPAVADFPSSDNGINSMELTVAIHGEGALQLDDPSCQANLTGEFINTMAGQASIDEDGVYLAGFSDGSGELVSDVGCELGDVTATQYSSIAIHGAIEATTSSCEAWCEAAGSAQAEARCEGSSREVACRVRVATAYSFHCERNCTTNAHYIAGDATISGSDLNSLNSGLGLVLDDQEIDLTLDHLEDASGNVIADF
jgi:hypothetical protein